MTIRKKLFKAYVLWMIYSRTHQNMTIAWDNSALNLGSTDVAFHST